MPKYIPTEILTDDEKLYLGDIVEKGAAFLKLDIVAAKFEELTGMSCGCDWRKELLNRVDKWTRQRFKRLR